jgi:hypothetical protein
MLEELKLPAIRLLECLCHLGPQLSALGSVPGLEERNTLPSSPELQF